MSPFTITINNKKYSVKADAQTPLLWVIRDNVGLTGTKYGCGMAQCGACTVHLDGMAVRSCSIPVSAVLGKKITTIEGLSQDGDHPVQQAWIEESVPQCGYCQSGQVMSAVHCGLVINPLLVETQLQGAVVFALQALHYGGITIKNGRVQQSNFHDYKMLRMDEVPEISVHVVPSTDPPTGVGEPGVPALAPAALNAIYAASGKRIRKIPVLKEDLL